MRFRVIVIDDNPSIHEDFRSVLDDEPSGRSDALDAEAALLFGEPVATPSTPARGRYALDHARQGQEGAEKVAKAKSEGRPYALAFVDMRMPPGWDGLRTIEALWAVDPDVEVVICTAFSDHTWNHIVDRLGETDKLLILKKPFDHAVVSQLAMALTEKWTGARRADEARASTATQLRAAMSTIVEHVRGLTEGGAGGDPPPALREIETIAQAMIERADELLEPRG